MQMVLWAFNAVVLMIDFFTFINIVHAHEQYLFLICDLVLNCCSVQNFQITRKGILHNEVKSLLMEHSYTQAFPRDFIFIFVA